ncbi:hypothetical protein [Nodularia sp. UHCC 0506]|nr:hypothetical protein [Nodularia sp. UHCC 0506]MEA5515622.1 hypothetical protein [Nodularia sp. UHCC 0506]
MAYATPAIKIQIGVLYRGKTTKAPCPLVIGLPSLLLRILATH